MIPGFTARASLYENGGQHAAGRLLFGSAARSFAPNSVYLSAKGQEFPDHTCTCKGCDPKGGDLTGQCATVCKDKEVYAKGSDANDYCKAALTGGRGYPLRGSFYSPGWPVFAS